MFLVGLYASHYVLCFIAVFVVITSRFEWKNVQRAAHLEGKDISSLMKPIQTRLYSDQSIREAIDISKEEERYFLMFDRTEKVVGVLFHEFIKHAQAEHDLDSPIEKYRSHSWENVPHYMPLEKVIALFQRRGYGIVPIMENDQLVGQLDIDQLNRFVNEI